jgi:hypothetical protein
MKANTRRTKKQEAAAPFLSLSLTLTLSLSVHFSSQQEIYNKAFSDI